MLFDLYEPVSKQKQNGKKITGYTIYDAEQKRRTKRNDLPEFYPDLPQKKYSIIYCDPPWDYNGKLQFDKSSKDVDSINLDKPIFISAANFKYPTIKTDVLKKIPIYEISENDCLLFMWVTSPHLAQGIELGHAWGFGYRTVAFVWDKMVHNPGQYTLSYCELCLVFKQGRTFYADKPQLFIVEYERNKTPNNKIEATGIKLDGFSALVAPAPHSNR